MGVHATRQFRDTVGIRGIGRTVGKGDNRYDCQRVINSVSALVVAGYKFRRTVGTRREEGEEDTLSEGRPPLIHAERRIPLPFFKYYEYIGQGNS